MDCGSTGPDSRASGRDWSTTSSPPAGKATQRTRRYDGNSGGDSPVIYGDSLRPDSPFDRGARYCFRGKEGSGVVVIPGEFIAVIADMNGLPPVDALHRINEDVGRVYLGVHEYSPVGARMEHGSRTRKRRTIPLPGVDRNMVVATVIPDLPPFPHGDGGVM